MNLLFVRFPLDCVPASDKVTLDTSGFRFLGSAVGLLRSLVSACGIAK